MTMQSAGSVAGSGRVPLLPEQRRFLTRQLPEEHHWNQVRLSRIPAELSPEQLRLAARVVIDRHDGLRTCLQPPDAADWLHNGVQVPALTDVPLEEIDLREVPVPNLVAAVTAHCTRIQQSMSMTRSPLLRLAHLALPGGEYRALLVIHHFVCDGSSFGIAAAEWEQACRALLKGREPMLPPPPTAVAEYARWLVRFTETPELREQLPVWQHIGRGAPGVPLELSGENTMATTDTVEAAFDQETSVEILDQVLPRLGIGVRDLFLTAAAGTLPGQGAGPALRTNLIGNGRRGLPGQPNLARTVGWLSTRYPVHVEVDSSRPFVEQVAAVHDQAVAPPHDGAGYGLLRYMHPDPDVRSAMAALGEPDITVNYLGRFDNRSAGRLFTRAQESPGPDETATGLREHVHGIDVVTVDGQLRVIWFYSTNQFTRSTIEGYLDDLLNRVRKGLAK